jgi:hypothetical protein
MTASHHHAGGLGAMGLPFRLTNTTRRATRLQVLHAPAGDGYVAWSSTPPNATT